jgi:hypothetical protein|tara:strand:- start:978 stop:1709 length:732 start_codon:yes stop_codon:yes gene_type:complete
VNNDKQFDILALRYKVNEKNHDYIKELEHQGKIDIAFRVSSLQEKIVESQREKYRQTFSLTRDEKGNDIIQHNTARKNVASISDNELSINKNKKKDIWQKDLSRRISLKTHPDKLGNLGNDEIDFYTDIYRKAIDAYRNGEDAKLLVRGHDVRLKPKQLNSSHITILVESIDKLQHKIAIIKNSDGFIWYHMTDEEKTTFLINYIKQMGFFINEKSAIEIIKRKRPLTRKAGSRPEKLQRFKK